MQTKVNCILDKNQGVELMKLLSKIKDGSIESKELELKINSWIQEAFEEGIRIGSFWVEKR